MTSVMAESTVRALPRSGDPLTSDLVSLLTGASFASDKLSRFLSALDGGFIASTCTKRGVTSASPMNSSSSVRIATRHHRRNRVN